MTQPAAPSIRYDVQLLADGDIVDITMYGHIGGSLFREGITASMVERTLKASPNAKKIHVRIASPGGSAAEAITIRSLLATHPAKVRIDVDGPVASAATVIATGGDHVRMHDGGSWMVHEAQTVTMGDAREHERALSQLAVVNDGAATLYAKRCRKSKEEMLKLMAAETWLTPAAAKEMGFVDEIIEGKSPSMHFDFAPYGYRNVPAPLMAADKSPTLITPAQEKPRMSFARIAAALSLSESADEATVLSAITQHNKQQHRREAVLGELRQITGQDSDDAILGAVRGLQQSAAQLPALKKRVDDLNLAHEKAERDALIAADKVSPTRKLTPALAKLYEDKSPAELKAFLAAAPTLSGAALQEVHQPALVSNEGGAPGAAPHAQLTYLGKPWEKLTPIERHNLRKSDEDTYFRMRRESESSQSA
jgi:ATP-dependent protease ClpP protease subunit